MACLTHYCRQCDNHWFDNEMDTSCPYCGESDYTTDFDELPTYFQPEDWRMDDEDQADAEAQQ